MKSLLERIELGEFEQIPKLADLLKSRNDSRAEEASKATALGPQEIAEELVKIRSMRGTNDSLFSFLGEIGLLGLFGIPVPVNLSTGHLESTPTTPRWWKPSPKKCLRDVEKALKTMVIPSDVARAMRIARRVKADRLLALFPSIEQDFNART